MPTISQVVENRPDVRREILIDAPPEVVWEVVAAPERQAEWFPGMVGSTVEGNVRTIATAVGGFFLEEILGIDHQARCFEYRITGPMQIDNHRGRITVLEALEGSRVVYEQEIDPKPLVSVLDGAIVDALEGLRALIEDGTTSRGWTPPTDTGVA